MNRYIIFAGVLVVIVAVGLVFFLRPSAPSPSGQGGTTPVLFPGDSGPPASAQQTGSKDAVRAVFQSELDKNNIDNTKLRGTVVAGAWALQAWAGDIMGGAALLKYDSAQSRWIIVESSGGSWSADALVARGVPQDIANILVAGMPQ